MKSAFFTLLLFAGAVGADPPVASYIYPAGGQRGAKVSVKVGGLFLHDRCNFEMLGPGVQAPGSLASVPTLWLEGPLLPLPESQRQEDYPKDMGGVVQIAADAPLGLRSWRVWTSQGATPAKQFLIGDLPEVIENELPGDPIPERVALPVTANGRIFPNEDVDSWSIALKKGQTVTARIEAARFGSPLDARLEVRGPAGRRLIENDDAAGNDPLLRFSAPDEGVYEIRINDVNNKGSQAHIYRLTLTSDPWVDRVFPLGGKRGSHTTFQLAGHEVPATQAIDVPATGVAPLAHQLKIAGKSTNVFPLDLDDLPEVMEDEAKNTGMLPAPGVGNGRILKAGENDRWTITAKKGDVLDFELRAQQLGSLLTGLLRIEDDKGKVMAQAEAAAAGKIDPSLRFTAPADGAYTVLVAEKFRALAGPSYAYRLRVAKAEAADFRLRLGVDALTLPRAGQINLLVTVELLGGFKQPITLAVEGLPPDVTVTGNTVAPGQAAATLTFKSTNTTKIQSVPLTIRGTAKVDGKDVARIAATAGEAPIDRVRLAVGIATPFKIVGKYEMNMAPRGSIVRRTYRIERTGFEGPLTVRMADRQARHLQGVTGPTIVVPAGAKEFEYSQSLPPWMEIGRTCRTCVMGIAEITDTDGSKHTVSFNSVHQNEQYVAIIEAARIELTLQQTSIRVEPGKPIAVSVRVTRDKGTTGPVRVELVVPEHVRGLSAAPLDISSADTTGTLTIRCEGENPGPFNMPLMLRATLKGEKGLWTAEAKLDAAR